MARAVVDRLYNSVFAVSLSLKLSILDAFHMCIACNAVSAESRTLASELGNIIAAREN